MKKFFFLFSVLSVAVLLTACSGDQKPAAASDGGEQVSAVSEEVDAEAEAAVKEYEEWFAKYDDITARSAKGEDVFDEIMSLQENVFDISDKLIKTEGKRNADQKARVNDIEEKVEKIKKERIFK